MRRYSTSYKRHCQDNTRLTKKGKTLNQKKQRTRYLKKKKQKHISKLLFMVYIHYYKNAYKPYSSIIATKKPTLDILYSY